MKYDIFIDNLLKKEFVFTGEEFLVWLIIMIAVAFIGTSIVEMWRQRNRNKTRRRRMFNRGITSRP